jgi:hypothetical protein
VNETVHCRRCGRLLKNPRSIAAGIGPDCAKREDADLQLQFDELVKETLARTTPADDLDRYVRDVLLADRCCPECGRQLLVGGTGEDEGSTHWYECPEHGPTGGVMCEAAQ